MAIMRPRDQEAPISADLEGPLKGYMQRPLFGHRRWSEEECTGSERLASDVMRASLSIQVPGQEERLGNAINSKRVTVEGRGAVQGIAVYSRPLPMASRLNEAGQLTEGSDYAHRALCVGLR